MLLSSSCRRVSLLFMQTTRPLSTTPHFFSDPVRVRFAPSPTGSLHLGGLRTALINEWFARSQGGTFILRIEDTDRKRFVAGAEAKMEETLQWAGVVADESPSKGGDYGPYRQSERRHIYDVHVERLLQEGHAYRCFCSEKRLDLLRRECARSRTASKYDGRCRGLTKEEVEEKLEAGEQYTVRFKLDNSGSEEGLLPFFHDVVFGRCEHDVFNIEGDPIVVKSDGLPTYHLASVIDDHSMRISHVLRGAEWQVSTVKHLLIYKAFGWTPPKFAHLPLIINKDGTKLSKRQADATVESYKDRGFYPDALVNFVSLLGGGFPGREQHSGEEPARLFSMGELSENFRLESMATHSGKLDFERLQAMSRLAIKERLSSNEQSEALLKELREVLANADINVTSYSDEYLLQLMKWAQDRIFMLSDLTAPHLAFLWGTSKVLPARDEKELDILDEMVKIVSSQNEKFPEAAEVSKPIKKFCKSSKIPMPRTMKVLRGVLTGSVEGPPVGEIVQVIGKEEALKRLEAAKEIINSSQ